AGGRLCLDCNCPRFWLQKCVGGGGGGGEAIVRELILTRRPVVAIDRNAERLASLYRELACPFVEGDATDEEILKRAGIERANGLFAALGDDHENLFIVVTARYLNPRLRIVARANETSVADRMKRAGADEVILPGDIGGLRMVSVMVRPAVVSFLDRMLRDRDGVFRVEEVTIPPDSPLQGRTLADIHLPSRYRCLVVALQTKDNKIVYVPPPNTVLEEGMTLILIGDVRQVEQIRRALVHH
ncbi:MAG: TrkA family potassium uptake protein, partial [Armatimonadota bacterium]|nr:TrkA family potassium uptake protein [Armatimonadota bacterium]